MNLASGCTNTTMLHSPGPRRSLIHTYTFSHLTGLCIPEFWEHDVCMTWTQARCDDQGSIEMGSNLLRTELKAGFHHSDSSSQPRHSSTLLPVPSHPFSPSPLLLSADGCIPYYDCVCLFRFQVPVPGPGQAPVRSRSRSHDEAHSHHLSHNVMLILPRLASPSPFLLPLHQTAMHSTFFFVA